MTTGRRRWLRFSLQALLVLLTAVCVLLGLVAQRMRRVVAQKEAVELILAAGGGITTDPEIADGEPLFAAPPWKIACGLASCPRITELYLTGDPREAQPRLAALADLERLQMNVFESWWNDRWCEAVAPLDRLVETDVRGAKGFTAQGFVLLVQPRLEQLRVAGADLDGLENLEPDYPSSLRQVNLEECQRLSGRAFAGMLRSEIEELKVDGAEFRDEDLADIVCRPSLKDLFVGEGRKLTAHGLQPLLGPKLERFRLSNGSVSAADLDALRFPSSLYALWLGGCNRLTNASVERIAQSCPNLVHLSLTSPLIDDDALEALARLKRGRRISLFRTGISYAGFENLARRMGLDYQVSTDYGSFQGDEFHPAWPASESEMGYRFRSP